MYVKLQEYKQKREMVMYINNCIGNKKYDEIEALGEKIGSIYIEEKEGKGVLKERLRQWKEEQKVLDGEDYKWIIVEWKKECWKK